MKKSILVFACFFMLIGQSAFAQLSAGAGLAYGSDSKDLGIQLRGIYQFNETWRAGGDFIFYLDGVENLSISELNTNAHYVFKNDETLQLYGLAGLNLLIVSISEFGLGTASELGINLGGGVGYPFTEKLTGIGEIKLSLGDASQLVLSVGVVYGF